MKDRNLKNHFSERIQSITKGWSHKTVQRILYTAIFVSVLALVSTSYLTADSVAKISLPGALASNSIDVNLLQGQKIDQINQANAVAASLSDNTGGQLANGSTSLAPAATATTVDEIKAANIASSVASAVNLSSSSSVSSNAESVNLSAELAQADATSVNKQQIIETSNEIKPLQTYIAQEGDNVDSIAQEFGVSAQTVRWANRLKDNNVTAGANMTIPVVDGVVYTIKDGDTLDAVAEKYGSDVNEIININNLNSKTVATGAVLLLPDGVLPETERPEYVAPRPTITTPTYTNNAARYTSYGSGRRGIRTSIRAALASGNRYAYGYCTWYAYNRRAALGMKLPSVTWGNANTWDTNARNYGYLVNGTPSVGAVFQTDSGYYGHVGIVEEVYADGSIRISEMNYSGWNVVTEGYLSPSDYYGYDFIH